MAKLVRWAGFWLGLLAIPASASLPPLAGVVQVAGGESHTCALTQAGAVTCWGRNQYGQLGDDSTVDRALPVEVVGLASGVQAISAGGDHTCALTNAGAVMCWGRNFFGQLGDGTNIDRRTPTPVFGLTSGVQAISAGERAFTCALRTTSGAVQCWGINDLGSLGNGGGTNSNVPTPVSGLSSGARAISAGNAHACAILSATNGLKCWGYNLAGQIGDGTTVSRTTPVEVSGLTSGVAKVHAGVLHTCAVTDTGAAKCWGNNFGGQLGDDSTINRFAPVDVVGLSSGVAELAAGHYHTCARRLGGTVWCWGSNANGQLGAGVESSGQKTAAPVPSLGSSVVAITAGRTHVCAIVAGGMLHCWGGNAYGQIGNGDVAWPTTGRAPVAVVGLSSGVVALAAGPRHTCARRATGAVQCWGKNAFGELGDGSNVRRFSPVTVAGLSGTVQMIDAGEDHTCALVSGAVHCWGSNQFNQLGAPGNLGPHPPVSVNLPGTTAMISANGYHTCAVNTAGRVSCWGMPPFVGPGGVPATLADLFSGIASVAAGDDHNCALTTSGVVRCWGSNDMAQFGVSGPDSPYQTVVVDGLVPVVQKLSAGRDHTCALTTTGRVQCWGFNAYGHAGSPAPVGYVGLDAGVQSLATGERHNCAVIGGAIKCWGNNLLGQLGNGGTAPAYVPVDVTGLSSGMSAVVSGSFHTCALSNAGGVMCWGDNEFGQMGDGRFPGVALPQVVLVDPAFFRDGFEGN